MKLLTISILILAGVCSAEIPEELEGYLPWGTYEMQTYRDKEVTKKERIKKYKELISVKKKKLSKTKKIKDNAERIRTEEVLKKQILAAQFMLAEVKKGSD